jgi:hypothetical protein
MGNDYKQELSEYKAARNIKPDDVSRPIPAKKDKKRWCGGKVGKEHKPICGRYVDVKNDYLKNMKQKTGALSRIENWYILYCSECGKELDTYNEHWKDPKPDWVVEG